MRWWFPREKKIWPKATAPPEAGPDFLCIGMPKSATGWLFDQLRHHPDFWLPSLKELRYLYFRQPGMTHAAERLERYADPVRRRRADPADIAFLEEAVSIGGQPMDIEKFSALFRFKGERMSGDMSPGYCRLQPERIAQVAARFPNAKILLLVRDPVSRLWSHMCMAKREKRFDVTVLSDPALFRAWFEKAPMRKQSYPADAQARWRRFAPNLPFRYFLFDDIVSEPARVRHDILAFLGANPRRKSGKIPVSFNRKSEQEKMVLTEPVKNMLVEVMADELRACAEAFGGAAKDWPARYGL